MYPYLICGKADETIKNFQISTGLSSNESSKIPNLTIHSEKAEGGRLQPDLMTLQQHSYTLTQ